MRFGASTCALSILAVAPDSAEAKARVLAALGTPSITAAVLAAADLSETPVKVTHRD